MARSAVGIIGMRVGGYGLARDARDACVRWLDAVCVAFAFVRARVGVYVGARVRVRMRMCVCVFSPARPTS